MIIQYEHHGKMVYVKKKLKGRHKNSCLCYMCEEFTPNDFAGDVSLNCPISQQVYELCVKEDLVLPVWECPSFRPKVKNESV